MHQTVERVGMNKTDATSRKSTDQSIDTINGSVGQSVAIVLGRVWLLTGTAQDGQNQSCWRLDVYSGNKEKSIIYVCVQPGRILK